MWLVSIWVPITFCTAWKTRSQASVGSSASCDKGTTSVWSCWGLAKEFDLRLVEGGGELVAICNMFAQPRAMLSIAFAYMMDTTTWII